jgi:glycosyltransferase involved in cell wall biosynthesis
LIPVLYGISQLHEGGSERQLYELAHRIAPFGFEPHVFTLTAGGAFHEALESAGVSVHALHRRSRLDPSPALEVWGLLRRHKIRILHTYDFYAGLFGRSAAFAARTPVRIHSERAVRAEGRANKSDAYFAADRLLARGTQRIIANAEAVKAFAVQDKGLPADKISVVYNGLNEAWFRTPDAAAVAAARARLTEGRFGKLVGIVARFDPMKDHATFFKAAQSVLHSHTDTRFVVIGKGALEGELRRMVDDLGIRQNVLFTDALWGDGLIHTVSALDVVVLTSKSGEGCSNAIIEAMALGKAPVGSTVGGTPELIVDGESGYLVSAGDAQGFADAIRRLIADDGLRAYMGAAAAERARARFSVGRMVAETLAIYEQVLRQAR